MNNRKALYCPIIVAFTGFFPAHILRRKKTLIIFGLLFFVSFFGPWSHWILAGLIPSFIPLLFKQIGTTIVFSVFYIALIFALLENKE